MQRPDVEKFISRQSKISYRPLPRLGIKPEAPYEFPKMSAPLIDAAIVLSWQVAWVVDLARRHFTGRRYAYCVANEIVNCLAWMRPTSVVFQVSEPRISASASTNSSRSL